MLTGELDPAQLRRIQRLSQKICQKPQNQGAGTASATNQKPSYLNWTFAR